MRVAARDPARSGRRATAEEHRAGGLGPARYHVAPQSRWPLGARAALCARIRVAQRAARRRANRSWRLGRARRRPGQGDAGMEHDWGRGSERGVGWRGAGVLGGTGWDGRRRLERLGHPKSLNMRLERRGMPLATCSGSSSRRIARLLLLVCTIFRQVLGLMGASRRPPPPGAAPALNPVRAAILGWMRACHKGLPCIQRPLFIYLVNRCRPD